MPDLRAFQAAFAAALLDPAPPAADAHEELLVHRNTVALTLRETLARQYPTVRTLVGKAWFDAVADRFARLHPPADGVLAAYGGGLDAFLDAFEPARELPYLVGVARLDRAWTEAHLAADAPVLAARDLAGLAPGDLAALRLVPHPSARWLRFEAPCFTIWRRHREADDGRLGRERESTRARPLEAALDWRDEAALLVRPALEVRWHALDAPAYRFLEACAGEASIADALERAGEARAWPMLVGAGAFGALLAVDRARTGRAPATGGDP
jgi:hypothetical protein